MKVGVHKLPMNSPNDVSALERLIDAGEINPAEIVALIGKTEGNGGANDFTRGFATLSYSLALAKRLGVSPEEVLKRVAFVWSGGTEGVLSPHATLFTRAASERLTESGSRLAWRSRAISRRRKSGRWPRFVKSPPPSAARRKRRNLGPAGRPLRPGQRPAADARGDRRRRPARRQARHARPQRIEAFRPRRDRARRRARARRSQRSPN